MVNDTLDIFGRNLMEEVRDESISCLVNEINGTINSQQGILMREMLSNFNEDQIETVINLIPTIIDMGLHYVLDMIDSTDDVKLLLKDEIGNYIEAKKLSDCLAGELYSEDGWIAKFSKQSPCSE